jgi:T4 gene Gp59 loader of gp41 DNA helicase
MKPSTKSALSIYLDYVALKAHFNTPRFNYFKYKHSKTANKASFEKRRDHSIFVWMAKHSNPFGLLLSNLSINRRVWIGDIASPEGQRIYQEWNKRIQSLSYTFKGEIKALNPDFNSNILVPKNGHPELFRLLITKKISLETVVIFVDLSRCFDYWTKTISPDDITWNEISNQIVKYRPFLAPHYDKAKYRAILKNQFSPK